MCCKRTKCLISVSLRDTLIFMISLANSIDWLSNTHTFIFRALEWTTRWCYNIYLSLRHKGIVYDHSNARCVVYNTMTNECAHIKRRICHKLCSYAGVRGIYYYSAIVLCSNVQIYFPRFHSRSLILFNFSVQKRYLGVL